MPLVRAATIGVACIASAVVVGSRLAMATREGGAVAGPGDRGAVRAGAGWLAWSVVWSREVVAVWLTGPLGLEMGRGA
jgi:hypothetical protein